MTTLIEFINLEYGANLTNIPLNKYFRFKPVGSKSKSMWVQNKGEIAFIGDYRTDEKVIVWKSDQHEKLLSNFNAYQKKEYFEKLRKEQEEIEAKETAEKQLFLADYWASADTVIELQPNDYFIHKRIDVRYDFKIDGTTALIPMYQIDGTIKGIQAISSNFKWFVKGSAPTNSFYPIRGETRLADCDIVYVVEGYATGYSLYELLNSYHDAIDYQVLVCFSSGNLLNIINLIKSKYPTKSIIGCADNDYPGKKAMQNIPHFWFDGADRWDVNDAYCKDKTQAFEELFLKLQNIKNPLMGIAQLDKFNDIVFNPEPHTYHLNGEQFISATTFIHQFSSFDSEKMAEHVAKKEGKTKEEILTKWKRTADYACKRGTRIHEYLEFLFGGKECETGTSAKDLYPIADKFKQDIDGKINIVKQEFRLYDIAWRICGTVDALGEINGEYFIIDWKSNKKINYNNEFGSKLKAPFNSYDDCEMINYSMQLSLYKLMIERNTNLKIKGLIIVHFSPEGWTRHICYDMTQNLINYFEKSKK